MALGRGAVKQKAGETMRVEATLGDVPWSEIAERSAAIERLGFDGIGTPELKRDPFLPLVLAASATSRVELTTSVAIAFPRSPTVVAYMARNLCDLSGGRFVVGLGTQVKGHIERRFTTEWMSPGPRLREYIQAMRAIWHTWDSGEPLSFRGKFYNLSLMTPEFSPPPSTFGPIKVQIAAVNEYNIRLAGELCDGLRVHPFSTPEYTRDVIWPNVKQGAQKVGRTLDDFVLNGTGFIATGADDATVAKAREDARYRIAFYASTRTYLPVLEHHGWGDLNPKLRELVAQNRWDDLPRVVPDEVLDAFCIAGTYANIGRLIESRLGGLVDTLGFPLPDDLDHLSDDYLSALQQVRAIAGAARLRMQ
ncbi:MAG TPA: TIGR03617 family F420-dependent LLM class oxidoreductase [Nitrolancea sp.]|nr:TIGR03617 family F420-dependent LLM class oxidoreductase [Nitrolancea sp.]